MPEGPRHNKGCYAYAGAARRVASRSGGWGVGGLGGQEVGSSWWELAIIDQRPDLEYARAITHDDVSSM